MSRHTPFPQPLSTTPDKVIAALDAINARKGWPGASPEPCAGHMVHGHRPIDGIDVTEAKLIQVRVAGVVVGVGQPWRAIGNAYVKCLLPHEAGSVTDPYSVGLHQGGALNDFQGHLLAEHGTHHYKCKSLRFTDRCSLCQAWAAERGLIRESRCASGVRDLPSAGSAAAASCAPTPARGSQNGPRRG